MSTTRKFDSRQAQEVIAFIRAGGYPLVAAEAAGIPAACFRAWLDRGLGNRARQPYRDFVRQVQQAMAAARLLSEHAVFQKDPRFWLKHGPGRELPRSPGWTGEVKAEHRLESWLDEGGPKQVDLSDLCSRILKALMPYPEARAAVVQALDLKGGGRRASGAGA